MTLLKIWGSSLHTPKNSKGQIKLEHGKVVW